MVPNTSYCISKRDHQRQSIATLLPSESKIETIKSLNFDSHAVNLSHA